MSNSAILRKNDLWDDGFVTLKSALSESIVAAGMAYQHERDKAYLGTGISELDGLLGGLYPSELVVVAGVEGSGKTSLATNIAFNVAKNAPHEVGYPVAFFSLDEPSERIATRIMSAETEIPADNIKTGDITEVEFEKLIFCSQEMQRIPLFIDQTKGLSVEDLASRAKRLKRQHGLALVIVDNLQAMRPALSSQPRYEKVYSKILPELKATAEALNVPVIAISRLSQPLKREQDGTPLLSVSVELNSFADAADVILVLDPDLRSEEKGGNINKSIELISAKNSRGHGSVVRVEFHNSTMKFLDKQEDNKAPLGSRYSSKESDKISYDNKFFLEKAVAISDEDLIDSPSGDAVSTLLSARLLGGEKVLGLSIRNPADLARAVQMGLPAAVLDYLREAGFNGPEIELLIAPARTLARRRKEGRLTVDESAAAERIARILLIADRVFGDRQAALAWLRRCQAARFGGVPPLSFLRSDIGARVVEEILLQAEYGFTA